MTALFCSILNMSITASYVAIAIIIIRMPLRKVPKMFLYVLWLPLWIRLAIPFSFSSRLSFLNVFKAFPGKGTGKISLAAVVPGFVQNNTSGQAASAINNAGNSTQPAVLANSHDPVHTVLMAAGIIWIAGIVLLLVYSIISYIKVHNNVRTATRTEGNVYESDRIMSPFVFGFIKPKIFVPAALSEKELVYVLAHERTHIGRLDYIIKPLAFLTVIIHWFNPLTWISFALMSRDMEMSCDESVIKSMGADIKGGYAKSLLSFSVKSSGLLAGSPLGFGESSVKSRIKNILSFKKPTVWVVTVMIVIIAAFVLVFASNPGSRKAAHADIYSGYDVAALVSGKTPYVGNNSKVVSLVDMMPLPEGIVRDTIALETKNKPYGLTINLKMKASSGIMKDGAVSGDALYRNVVILFSLIGNVDVINCRIYDETKEYKGTSYAFTYTRDMAEKLAGGDVRHYAADAGALKGLIDRVNKVRFNAASTAKNDKIENYLAIITSPGTSSNPYDYIKDHRTEYESILKMGDEALDYLLAQFEKGGNNDLKGYIMMALCKDLLGDRNNVADEGLLPQKWFSKLSPYTETKLPDFKSDSADKVEQLVCDAAVKKYSRPEDGFTVVAPTVFAKNEDAKTNKLAVLATVYSSRYKLYEKTLSETGGCIVPAKITFVRNADGSYTLQEYREAMDGSYFAKSIKEFAKAFGSEKLYHTIMEDYGSNGQRSKLLMKNIKAHLKANNQKGVALKKLNGTIVPLT